MVQTNRSDRNRNTVGLTRVDEGLFEAEFRGIGREDPRRTVGAFGELYKKTYICEIDSDRVDKQ